MGGPSCRTIISSGRFVGSTGASNPVSAKAWRASALMAGSLGICWPGAAAEAIAPSSVRNA